VGSPTAPPPRRFRSQMRPTCDVGRRTPLDERRQVFGLAGGATQSLDLVAVASQPAVGQCV
jgi:hypothetical protein